MVIDEAQTFSLMKYASTKGIRKIVKSDHNIIFSVFDISYQNVMYKKPRRELFNLKNKECQEIFSEVTECNLKLQKCFNAEKPFPKQCQTFFKTLDGILHQSFRKVRVGKTIEKSDIQDLLNEKLKVQKFIDSNQSKEALDTAQKKITLIEEELSKLCAERNCNIVKEFTKNLSTPSGNFNQLGMWKLKNKLMPREVDPPMAKLDKHGNLITSPGALKSLYLDTYVERLKHRDMEPGFMSNYFKKVELWEMRFKYLKTQNTEDWTEDELTGTLKQLKNNKTRDPAGLINEIFKPSVIGKDLKEALLKLINGIKREFYFPLEVLNSNITSIYKRKGSRLSMENDRGIFGLSIFKKIIDKIVYIEKVPQLDENMSDSNIGARRGKNVRNHLFIIHGIINHILKEKKCCVDLHIYDLIKAFDALWVADSMNNLWDTLPEDARDDRLGLVFESSRTNMVAVNTPAGQTQRVNIPEIAQQGGTWGPMMCSNSIDGVGKYAKGKKENYSYKNLVEIIPLAMVDDLLSVTICGADSIKMNITINTLI